MTQPKPLAPGQATLTSRAMPHPAVAEQLTAIELDPARPLIVTDADEVLFAFMEGFEDFLHRRELFYDWSSFALIGNVRRKSDDSQASPEEVRQILKDFFVDRTEKLRPVDHAAASLDALSRRAQVLVLSNIPPAHRDARRRALKTHDMDYPLIANIGPKGAVVAHLAGLVDAPVFFIDDIPGNHTSVKIAAEHVQRLHFVADPRLARMLDPAEDSHHRLDSWPEMRGHIESHLERHGF